MGNQSPCIECGSTDTRLEDRDVGFVKVCEDCGYVGGPYVSTQTRDTEPEREQVSLTDF